MSETLKFAEDGFELYESLAHMMDEALHEVAAGTGLGLTMGGVVGAAAFVIGMLKLMTDDSDNEMVQALKKLQQQIDEIKGVLVMLDDRIDQLVDQVAIDSNRQTLRDLLDYLDDFRRLAIELKDRPRDTDTAVRVANEAGILCDKFLRSDYEIWRWIDIVKKPYVNPATGQTTMQNALALGRFKNIPTLSVYAAGLLTWLAAREKAREAGQGHRLADDQARLERHRDATAVRSDFDKYSPDAGRSRPHSIPEHIKSRIRAYPVASDRHANNRICRFYFDAGNLMTNRRASGEPFDMVMPPGIVLCTLDPGQLGTPSMEIDMELAAGVETLRELTELLGRLAGGGSLAGQVIGVFPTVEVFGPAILYVVDENADLQWYRNESAAARGGSREWAGPKKVGNGWGGFVTAFNAGGAYVYGIQPDGTLLWYAHDGNDNGGPTWRGPKPVGSGWQGFKSVFSGGEHIVYGIQPDGRLLWYRHDGANDQSNRWAGPLEVGTGWQGFQKVFSGGDGTVYAIRPDGVLLRYIHKGYLDGSPTWEGPKEIGTGWGGFQEVVAAADGVFYAFTRDGRVLWYRFGKRPPLPEQPAPDLGLVGRVEDMVVERPGSGAVGRFRPGAVEQMVEQAQNPGLGLRTRRRSPSGNDRARRRFTLGRRRRAAVRRPGADARSRDLGRSGRDQAQLPGLPLRLRAAGASLPRPELGQSTQRVGGCGAKRRQSDKPMMRRDLRQRVYDRAWQIVRRTEAPARTSGRAHGCCASASSASSRGCWSPRRPRSPPPATLASGRPTPGWWRSWPAASAGWCRASAACSAPCRRGWRASSPARWRSATGCGWTRPKARWSSACRGAITCRASAPTARGSRAAMPRSTRWRPTSTWPSWWPRSPIRPFTRG